MKLLVLFLAIAASVMAESVLDYTKLPACARQCAILDQAEKNCVPPAAPVTDQGIYQSCFCLSALLTPLKADGSLCQQACQPADAAKISQYYVGFCNGPVVKPPAPNPAPGQPAATTSATATATAGAAGTVPVSTDGKQDWLSAHWPWVVFVIVVFVAMVFFWVGGIYLRRHFDRKRDARNANQAAINAPYNPSTPGANPNVNTNYNPSNIGPPPPMTMSGGRNGTPMSAVGRPAAMRSRSSTLQSLGLGNSSKANVSQPVVWGPHQHLAHANANGYGNNGSPSNSVPPSPTVAMTPPQASFRNREAIKSEPRVNYRGMPTSNPTEMRHYGPGPPWDRPAAATAVSADNVNRPATAIDEPIRDVKRRTLSAVKSDPTLHTPQTAEICEPSPEKQHQKLHKPQKL